MAIYFTVYPEGSIEVNFWYTGSGEEIAESHYYQDWRHALASVGNMLPMTVCVIKVR